MRMLPRSAVRRIIRNSTGMRVGDDAATALTELLEEIGEQLSVDAGKFAKHAGRRTVKARDLKLAYERVVKGGE